MATYYDGTKLLSMQDINGNKPEIYLCTTNRTGGKTTFFNTFVTNKFLKGHGKFMLVYRFNYELDDVADKFFKDIGQLFFTGSEMVSQRRANGIYHELFLNNKSCGYAVSLNSADQIKKYSHLFSDTERMLMDEFQSETNHYCPREVEKLISIHTSVARGKGKQIRYVPIYMISNQVTILNPYYVELGISERLTDKTNFLRGDGFVLEQGFVESAYKAQLDSGFNKAFSKNKYVQYAAENIYLNDNATFVEKPNGFPKYIATIRYKGSEFGIKEYAEQGIVYCDDKADITFPMRISVTTDDHQINYVMLKRNDAFIATLRYYFDHGCFRFKDLKCKEAVLKALSY